MGAKRPKRKLEFQAPKKRAKKDRFLDHKIEFAKTTEESYDGINHAPYPIHDESVVGANIDPDKLDEYWEQAKQTLKQGRMNFTAKTHFKEKGFFATKIGQSEVVGESECYKAMESYAKEYLIKFLTIEREKSKAILKIARKNTHQTDTSIDPHNEARALILGSLLMEIKDADDKEGLG